MLRLLISLLCIVAFAVSGLNAAAAHCASAMSSTHDMSAMQADTSAMDGGMACHEKQTPPSEETSPGDALPDAACCCGIFAAAPEPLAPASVSPVHFAFSRPKAVTAPLNACLGADPPPPRA